MSKTITGLYDDLTTARKIVSDLQDSGVQRENISLEETDSASTNPGEQRKGSLVSVQTPDEIAPNVTQIMNRYHPRDIREQAADQNATPVDFNPDGTSLDDQEHRLRGSSWYSAPSGDATRDFWPDDTQKRHQVIPGETVKTEWDDEPLGAGMAVYTHNGIVERSELPPDTLPISDQPLGDEVEAVGTDTFENDFRDHYDAHYATSDFEYVQFQPAYRYGYELGMDERFHELDWRTAEGDIRREWESTHPTSPWVQFKDAIHFGWDAARSRRR